MKKALKKIVIILLCCILSFPVLLSSAGCSLLELWLTGISEYYGDYPELYTMACHSLITNGYNQCGEYECQAGVVPLETDSYGRILFCFVDDSVMIPENRERYYQYQSANYALLICQYSDDINVYYYQDYNFINKDPQEENGIHWGTTWRNRTADTTTIDDPLYGFSDEDIIHLKEWNDWDKPIDKSKCVSTPIGNDFYKMYNSDKKARNVLQNIKLFDYDALAEVIAKDKFDNQLILVFGRDYVGDKNNYKNQKSMQAVIIVSKSYRYLNGVCSMIFSDEKNKVHISTAPNYAYQEALKKLRADNYWNVCDLDEVIAQQTSSS